MNVFLSFVQMNELLNIQTFDRHSDKESHVWSPQYSLPRSHLWATTPQGNYVRD